MEYIAIVAYKINGQIWERQVKSMEIVNLREADIDLVLKMEVMNSPNDQGCWQSLKYERNCEKRSKGSLIFYYRLTIKLNRFRQNRNSFNKIQTSKCLNIIKLYNWNEAQTN